MKIEHINHASLLIEDNGKYILTDPWVISPAFGGWTQHPYPPTELIEKIISIPSENLLVAVFTSCGSSLVSKDPNKVSLFIPTSPDCPK